MNIHEGKTSVSIIYITFKPLNLNLNLNLNLPYACAYTRKGRPNLAEQSS